MHPSDISNVETPLRSRHAGSRTTSVRRRGRATAPILRRENLLPFMGSGSRLCPAPRFCFVIGLYWTTFGLRPPVLHPAHRPAAVEVLSDFALESRRRAIGLLPSLALLENGTRRRPARDCRVCRRHRLGHRDLHRRQRRAAAAAAVPGRRTLRVAVRREHDQPGHVQFDVGPRAAGLPAADHELRRVRLVPHRPIPSDGPWRAAIRSRRGGDAGARAAARSTAPRPVVRDDTSAVISSALWRRLGGGREIIGSAITLDGRQLHDQRRHAANVPASARESGDITRRRRGVDSARSVATRREPGQPATTSRTPAANPGYRWNRRRRTPSESPPPSPPSIPHATRTTRRAWPTCARRRSRWSARASAPR